MNSKMNVVGCLQNTSKGQLSYDTTRQTLQTLEECTSPPKLSFVSPEKQLHVSPNDCNVNRSNATWGWTSRESSCDISLHHPDLIFSDGHNSTDVSELLQTSRRTSFNHFNTSQSSQPVEMDSELFCVEEKNINAVERQWTLAAQSSFSKREQIFTMHAERVQEDATRQLLVLHRHVAEEAVQVLRKAHSQDRIMSEEMEQNHQKMKEHHRLNAKRLGERMQEANEKRLAEQERQRKRQEEFERQVGHMVEGQTELTLLQQQVADLLTCCLRPLTLTENMRNCNVLMDQIHAKASAMIEEVRSSGVIGSRLQDVLDLRENGRNLLNIVNKQVEQVNSKVKEEEVKLKAQQQKQFEQQQLQQQQQKQQQQQQASLAAATAAATATAVATAVATAAVAGDTEEVLCAPEDAFEAYQTLQTRLTEVETQETAITGNTQLKRYRFDLQKAINTPVNAIAATSGSHLRDKLQRITALLSGHQVDIGSKRVSTAEHPMAIAFCSNLFASKIVKQGDEQISSNHESAFPVAAVAIGVWCECPAVGELLLAHFHRRCPYLVPYHVPKKSGQTSEEYYSSIGYKHENGEVEKQDKFLKRMSGIMRLYAAIIISAPPGGRQRCGHPHGLEHGWAWLTRVTNMQPWPDITATLLFDFLEVTGHAFMKTYGRQFNKLLQAIVTDFVPKLRLVSLAGAGGPVARLEIFLEKCIKSRQIRPPEGLLPAHFWQT